MIALRHSYAEQLEGMYAEWQPEIAPDPQLYLVNEPLARELGLDPALLRVEDFLTGERSIAMAYAGHQFGGFSPSLGDGRAVLLGEIETDAGLLDVHLKGSGQTPFSRGGDGKAGLAPVLREYLMGEAMHALGIPTTRALAVITTGETIFRDSGTIVGSQPGAILVRVAASHLRVGTFQFFAARGETDRLQRLFDFTCARHYPGVTDPLELLTKVMERQAELIALWMGVGFVHGVMNTDNMALSGETIDYGPCAFLDAYAPGAVFSAIDRNGRYAYANQPPIAAWNLSRFAESLLPLMGADLEQGAKAAQDVLAGFQPAWRAAWLRVMGRKLGRDTTLEEVHSLFGAMVGEDFTGSFRALTEGGSVGGISGGDTAVMAQANPCVIPRNHLVDRALLEANNGDQQAFDTLLAAVMHPFDTNPAFEQGPSKDAGRHRTFCGT